METSVIYFWSVVVCFFGSFYFSMTETALTGLSLIKAEEYASSPNWFKKSIRYWLDHPNRLLTAILVGNTIANMTGASLVAAYFTIYYPHFHLGWITLGLTAAFLIFSEIAPKMLARAYPDKISPYACRILVYFNYIIYPVTTSITRGISLILSVFGLITSRVHTITHSDIEQMVLLAGRSGSIEKEKTRILSSVFEFSKRRVREIMIPKDRISAISIDASLVEILDIVRKENHSRYPVYKQSLDKIVGFLHARDLFGVLRSYGFSEGEAQPLEKFSLRTCLRRAFFVPEQALISRVLNDMKSNRIHLALVKDEWGNVVGLVTLEDILEEVFGEIDDEHDEATQQKRIEDIHGGGIEVDGGESILDLRSRYGVELDESESYSTLNGFLQHYAANQTLMPKMVIIWKNYVFTLLDVKEGEVERVRITEIPEVDD